MTQSTEWPKYHETRKIVALQHTKMSHRKCISLYFSVLPIMFGSGKNPVVEFTSRQSIDLVKAETTKRETTVK